MDGGIFSEREMLIQIKNRFSGAVIFEHDCEDNSIKLTLKLAFESGSNLSNANLRCADLRNADLSNANLSSANLRCADLRNADLRCADLRNADLSSANLSSANLRCADLRNADLSNANLSSANLRCADLRNDDLRCADLRNADLSSANLGDANLRCADLRNADLSNADLRCFGDMKIIFTLQLDNWQVGFTKDVMQIGCKRFKIEEWREFTDDVISKMDSNALAWWKRWKYPLFAIIDERLKDLSDS